MTGWGRAFYGAAFGSLLTLIAHPTSRPVILGLWYQPAKLVAQTRATYVLNGQVRLPPPTTPESASLWIQSGSERHRGGSRLTRKELTTLLQVARQQGDAEPQNAFWKQMCAVYYRDLGNTQAAKNAWMDASHCASWNDYQSVRLVQLRDNLAIRCRSAMTWQAALAFIQRSKDPVLSIDFLARWLLSGCGMVKPEDVSLRLATLRNGALIMNGSRSIEIGQMGSELFDAGCGVEMNKTISRRDRYRARYFFKSQVGKILGPEEADADELLLRRTDAWNVLTSTDPAKQDPKDILGMSALTGSLPGTFLGLGLLGVVLFAIGWTARFWPSDTRWRTALLVSVAVFLGYAAYRVIGFPVVGLLVGLSIAFQSFTPVEGDRRLLKRLGSLFEIAVTVFALALMVVVGMFFFGDIAAGAVGMQALGVPSEYLYGSPILTGIAIIILCLVLVVPPAWAISQRVSTSQVVRLMFQRLGGILAASCLTLAIVSTPIMLIVDRGLSQKMDRLLENEPLYYVHP